MFDHRSKREIFDDLLDFKEVWCVLRYKIVIKALEISLVVKIAQMGAIWSPPRP